MPTVSGYSTTDLLFANNAGSTLAGPISNVSTTLTVQAGAGVLFPVPSAGQGFVITAIDAATGLLREIMLCTNVSTDTLTVTRGQEGTTALNWNANDLIQELFTAGQMASMLQLSQIGTNVFGPTPGASSANAMKLLGVVASAPAILVGSGSGTTLTGFNTPAVNNLVGATTVWDGSSGKLTIGSGEGGAWTVSLQVGFASGYGGYYSSANITQNGTGQLAGVSSPPSGDGAWNNAIGPLKCAPGDVIRLLASNTYPGGAYTSSVAFSAFLFTSY